MEVLGAAVIIKHLTSVWKQGLDMFPYPLSPITDDAEAHLLFWNYTGLFHLLEGLTKLLLILYLMPTEHMDDALAIQQIKAKALRVAPLPPPPRPPGPLAPAPRAGLPGTVGTGRYIGPINAQHQDRPAKATSGHGGDAPLDLLARRYHVQHGQPRAHVVGYGVHPFAPAVHPRQISKERLGRVIRHFGDQLHHGVLHVELFTPCHQTQRVIERVEPYTTSAAIEVGSLQRNRPHHRLDRAPDVLLHLEHPRTPRAVGLRALAFTFVDMRHNHLCDAPGELLAQVPHGCGHFR